MKLEDLLDKYGVSLQGFEASQWGNPINKLKYPASYVKRWTDPTTGFDQDGATKELLLNAINIIRAVKPFIRKIDNYFEFLPEDLTSYIKGAVYQLAAHMVLNRNIWERVNTSAVQIPNFTQSIDTAGWLVPVDMVSQFANNLLRGSEIDQYELIDTADRGAIQETFNGNYKIISTIEDVNSLTLQYIEKVCTDNGVSAATAKIIADTLKGGLNG